MEEVSSAAISTKSGQVAQASSTLSSSSELEKVIEQVPLQSLSSLSHFKELCTGVSEELTSNPMSPVLLKSEIGSSEETLSNNVTASSSAFVSSSNIIGSHEIIDCDNRKDSTSSNNNKKPVQDSEDSSYDSDCEVSDGTSHYDVSRTVSDTLGQEFAEYVTLSKSGGDASLLSKTQTLSSSSTAAAFESDPGYGCRVDFAKKLGYTEAQVRIALSKLGPSPSQNELLSELILLDSTNTSSLVEQDEDAAGNKDNSSNPGGGGGGGPGLAPSYGERGLRSDPSSLRHIVIDGSNVAMSHGSNKIFSCRGIQLAVEYFKSRGHKYITVFVPSYRKENSKPDDPVSGKEILVSLEKDGILVYTPSRVVNNRRLVCYDDRYILKLAVEVDGIVVSNDNYRDLTLESPDFKRVVEERLLMYSFVNDRFMPPEDPLGRNGPKLDQFLSKAPVPSARPCPYGRKCTYGQKCKYYHVTQQKSVSETLRKQAAMKTQSVPITKTSPGSFSGSHQLQPISRTKSAIVPMESGIRNDIFPHSIVGAIGGSSSGNAAGSIGSSTSLGGGGSGGGANPHRKLQRQLSINPVGDPRISQTWRNEGSTTNVSLDSSLTSARSTTYLHPFPGNPILSEVWSPPAASASSSTSTSQALRSPQKQQGDSMGIPNFGDLGSPNNSSVGQIQQQQQQSNRTRMYYHLAAIFPEDQVRHVMSLYPDETDPSFICRVIVNLFK